MNDYKRSVEEMDYRDVRKGATQAEFNDTASTFLFGEIFIVSVGLGIAFTSWFVFGLALLGLIILVNFKSAAIYVCGLFSICWGALIFVIGDAIGGLGAGIVLGIIALIVSVGLHIGAMEYVEDMR